MKQISRKPLSYYLGTGMMIAALVILLYIYTPIAMIYLAPAPIPQQAPYAFTIIIPKIHATAPIIPNVDPNNEHEYMQKLKKGVALAKGFATPDKPGVMYMFAHSSDYPWNITRYNTAFFRLYELKPGDTISVYYKTHKYVYTVKELKTVWPSDVDAVNKTNHRVVLQTCTPIGTSFQRLLVFAD